VSAARDRFDESARLHRARRAQERRALDEALAAADRHLQAVHRDCAEAVMMLVRGRLTEALHRMSRTLNDVQGARVRLRQYFDFASTKD